VIFSDLGFHAKEGDHPNLKVCEPHTHNERMIIETSLSLLTTISHFKKVFSPDLAAVSGAIGFHDGDVQLAHFLGMASRLDPNGVFHLSIAEFSL